jgi:eukaryotic-like serine/threonine-protein kinase
MSSSDHQVPARPDSRQGTRDSADPHAHIGRIIDGRYRVLEHVGQGGMGSVYRAEHVTIRRPVALKLLHPGLASIPELERRFEREAYAIGRIDHPNCVNVSDFGKLEDGSLFLVMELLEGQSLGDLLERERRVEIRRALHITRHVLRGLHHAHRRGIVHRDVKPENVVLVEHDGDHDFAKVLDFGIAKLVGVAETEDGSEKLTQAGIAFGTPIYLSPEQAIGEPADPRSDLYSATVMLYEMITGVPPFRSEDKLELLGMHTTRPPPRAAEMAPDLMVPEPVEALLVRGLAKRPADRFADAGEYVAAIDAVVGMPAPGIYGRAASEVSYAGTGWGPGPDSPPGAARPLTQPPYQPPYQPSTTTPLPLTQTPPPGFGNPAHTGSHVASPTSSSARRALVAFGAVVFGLLVATVIWISGDDSPRIPLPAVGQETDVGARAEAELKKGDPDKSVETIQAGGDADRDARTHLTLGHAFAARSDYAQALEAYVLAVELDPALGKDAEMRASLQLMIDDEGEVFPHAARLLWVHAGDRKARQVLLDLAAGDKADRRREAFSILEELGLGDEIDRTASFTWDLRQGKDCESRRQAVAKLRALGDKKAIPALEQARVRKSGRRGRNQNACLRQHAEDAIKYLQTLPE